MSQELARRCLWLYRVFTQRPESTQTLSLLAQEQKRRLDIVYKELRVSKKKNLKFYLN